MKQQSGQVDYVKSKHQNKTRRPISHKGRTTREEPVSSSACTNCSKTHQKGKCPAKGKQCNFCHKWNHFASACRKKTHPNVNDVRCEENNVCESVFVDSVESKVLNGQVLVELGVGRKAQRINFKIKTGSQVNILPLSEYLRIDTRQSLKPTKLHLSAYNGSPVRTEGTSVLPCFHAQTGHSKDVEFYVVHTKANPLLSLQTSLDVGLLKLSCSVNSQTDMTEEHVI